jgi:membrane-bound acyltransferase YfiQ involved in biofilm formation
MRNPSFIFYDDQRCNRRESSGSITNLRLLSKLHRYKNGPGFMIFIVAFNELQEGIKEDIMAFLIIIHCSLSLFSYFYLRIESIVSDLTMKIYTSQHLSKVLLGKRIFYSIRIILCIILYHLLFTIKNRIIK